jgi:hypothetical protein
MSRRRLGLPAEATHPLLRPPSSLRPPSPPLTPHFPLPFYPRSLPRQTLALLEQRLRQVVTDTARVDQSLEAAAQAQAQAQAQAAAAAAAAAVAAAAAAAVAAVAVEEDAVRMICTSKH